MQKHYGHKKEAARLYTESESKLSIIVIANSPRTEWTEYQRETIELLSVLTFQNAEFWKRAVTK